MLTVTPDQLRAYLAVLPKDAFQVELKVSADGFSLRMNLAPPAPEGQPRNAPVMVGPDGQPVPENLAEQLAEMFPQGFKQAGA